MAADRPEHDAEFTESEMRVIFERAGQLDRVGDDGERRRSLAELQEIGAQAGLDPRDIAAAAESVRAAARRSSIAGAPARFRVTARFDRQFDDTETGEIIRALRDATGYHGSLVRDAAYTEWRARSALGAVVVSVETRPQGSWIEVVVSREDARFLGGLVSGFAGLGLGAWMASLGAHTLGWTLGPSLGAGAVVAAGSAWAIARSSWRPISQRWAERTKELLAAATEAVRRE